MVGGEWGGCHLDNLMTGMNAFGGGPSRAVPPNFYAVASSGVRDLLADLQSGRSPPLQAFEKSLPYLRAAAMVSRGTLLTTAKRRAEPFERRGEPILYLGPDGRVVEVNAAAEHLGGQPVRLVNRRLIAEWQPDQPRLDRALAVTLVEGRPALVTLSGEASAVMALVLPVEGDAQAWRRPSTGPGTA